MSTNSLIMLLGASTAWAAVAPAYAPPPAYTTSVTGGSECAKTCVAAFDACRGAPEANQSFCGSQLAACVHYNPFDGTVPFVTPTACSAAASATVSTSANSPPVYTSPASSDDCAKKCIAADSACRVGPNANQAQCSAEFAACVGYNPYATQPFVTPTACSSKAAASTTNAAPPAYTTGATGGSSDCAAKCLAAEGVCRTAPGANQSKCSADLAACVGYNPFASQPFVTPTACSSSASATASAPTGATGGSSDCAAKCLAAESACRTAPSANQAQCSAELAACVGYNPFASQPFVTPTACSAGAAQPTGAAGNGTNPAVSATYTAPAQYTGGASLMSGSFLAMAAGAVGLMI